MATNHNFRIKNGLHVQGGTATFHSVNNNSDLVIGGVINTHSSETPARITTSSTGHLYLDSTSGQDLYLNWWNSSSSNIITESKIRAPAFYDRNDTSKYVNPASDSVLNNLSMVGASTYLPAHAYTHTHDGTNVYWHVGSASGSTNKVLNLRVYKSDNTNYTLHQFLTTGANITGNLNVTGNLSVTGTIDRNNVTDLDVVDKTITVGVGQTEANSGDSGLIVAGSAASMLWNETSDRFEFNKKIYSASNIAAVGNLSASGVYSSNNFYSLNTAGSDWDLVIGRNGGVPYADMKHSYRINGTAVIDSSRNITANTAVTIGDNTTAGILRVHYNDASYMTLAGYGLEMNRSSSYIRPTTDGNKTLYIGGADATLDWSSIYFRSTNGLYMSGTRFLDASRNLTNIGNITASGNLIMASTTSRIELGTYLKFYGAAHSNTAALAVNANYDGGATDSWTPDYAGASSAGMFLLRESSGGGGSMQAWVKNHGTTGGSHARSTFTEVARFDQAGYFFGHNIRTELMYDVNNTSYYVNPASNTVLNTASIGTTNAPTAGYGLRVASIQMHGAGSLDYISQLHFADNLRFYDEGNDSYLNFKWGDTGGGGIQFFNGSGARQGYVYGDNGNFGLLASDGSWGVNVTNAKTQIYHRLDTPIMYDMDDTSYYVNPASSDSKIVGLNIHAGSNNNTNDASLYINKTSNGDWGLFVHGTSSGTEYGVKVDLAGTHSYGLRAMNSGSEYSRLGTDLFYHNNSIRAPIFYDSDNTTYYANLSSASDSIRTAGTVRIGVAGHLGLGGLTYSKLAIPGENAAWSGSGTTTGQVVIDLPGNLNNYDMIYLEIDVYEYSSQAGSKIIVGGHNWNSGGNGTTTSTMWHNVGVQIVGRFDKEIFFGWRNNGSVNKRVIVLGSTSSSWSYGTVRVSSVSGATDFYATGIDYTGDWNVTQSTSGTYYTKSPTTNFNDTDKRVIRVHRAMQAQRMYGDSDMRAPVFYDLNNTTYRADPASNSVFNTMDITQIDVANAGMISFYGNGSRDHSISSYLDDDIRINSYGAMYINLDSNGNNDSAADFKVIKHASTGSWAASQELFKVDGETGKATVKDGIQLTGNSYFLTAGNNANNFKIRTGTSGAAGIVLSDSANAFRAQLYGDTSGYGFLTSEWGSWDIKKVLTGRLYTNNTTSYYLQPNSNSKFQWLNINAGNEAPAAANSSVDGLVLRSGVSSYNTTTTTWGHKFHKHDPGGGVPLYLSATIGSAAWAAQQRWGTYTGNGYTSQIFGSLKVDTSVTTPIFYDSDDTAYYLTPASTGQAALKMQGGINIKSGHGSGDVYLHYDYNGSDTYKGTMLMFVSEPGVTHDGGGIGTNINISTPYYGRAIDHGYGVYLRFAKTAGTFEFWNTQGTAGTANGRGTMRFWGSNAGDTTSQTSSRAPIFYDSDDTAYFVNPAASGATAGGVSGKFRNTVIVGDGSNNVNSGTWGARLNITDSVHSKIEVDQSSNGVKGMWYAHSGQQYVSFGTNTAHPLYLKRNEAVQLVIDDGYVNANNQFRAPIFYDNANTARYVDPNGGSIIHSLSINDAALTVYEDTNLAVSGGGHGVFVHYNTTTSYRGYWDWRTLQFGNNGANNILFGNTGTGGYGKFYVNSTAISQGGGTSGTLAMQLDSAGNVFSFVTHRAPIYYDQNNTAYYTDSNGTSVMNIIDATTVYGDDIYITGGWFRNHTNSNGMYWSSTGHHFYPHNTDHMNLQSGSGSTTGLRLTAGSNVRGFVYGDGSNNFGLLDNVGNWRLKLVAGDYGQFDGSSVRAQLFYDTNNTNYYADPASTSVLHKIKADTIYGFTKNYASSELWAVTTSDSNQPAPYGGNFSNNGEINTVEWGETPRIGTNVRRGKIWKTRNNDSSSNDDGGWNKSITGLDVNKAYMSVVYVKRASSSTSGSFYHGCDGNSTNTHNLNNTGNSNPYFTSFNISTLEQDEWYVSVGIIQAANDTNTSNWTIGGLWKLSEGVRVNGYATYKMGPTGNGTQNHRTYLYYSTDANAALDWYAPGFYEINGSEPSIEDLLGRPIEGSLASLTSDAINITASISNDTDNNGSVNSSDALNFFKGQRGTAAGMRIPSIGVEGGGTGIYLRKKSALETATSSTGHGSITIAGGVESGGTETTHFKHASTWADGSINNFISGTAAKVYNYYTGSSASTDAVALTSVDVSGNFIAKGNVTAYGTVSDIRLKENIEVIPNALEKVQKLRGVTFNYKEDNNRSTGLIAQELQEVLPEVVYETENIDTQEKHYAVRYGNITGLLVEAMKEQSDQINAQQKQINELTSLIKTLLDK